MYLYIYHIYQQLQGIKIFNGDIKQQKIINESYFIYINHLWLIFQDLWYINRNRTFALQP